MNRLETANTEQTETGNEEAEHGKDSPDSENLVSKFLELFMLYTDM